ncbi:MAG: SGNH/GDSL hydrolase family protein [Limisphaerales bacterium]
MSFPHRFTNKFWSNVACIFLALPFCLFVQNAGSAELKLSGDWQVEVTATQPRFLRSAETLSANLTISPSAEREAQFERYDSLPIFQPTVPVWAGEGTVLRGLRTCETASDGMLVADSLRVYTNFDATPVALQAGKDYGADLRWSAIGRLSNGSIQAGQPVFASYRFYQSRLDAVVQTGKNNILIREGIPTNTTAMLPPLEKGDKLLATIWIPGRTTKLTAENVFPILETKYPEPPKSHPSQAELRIPKSLNKLRRGEPIRILAWGDSVTDAGYLPHPETDRWQAQFVTRLRARFPKARIELISEAWGGRTTGSYLAEPPGSLHNYKEKVLGAKPDLIVSEFVNDAGLSPAQVREVYGKLLTDFQSIGAEWIILTPHYVRPDWMGLTRLRDIDNDPRPYVAGLRQFAAENPVGLADASKRWGRLWRQGIPYTTLFINSINHPDARGMAMFADSLMELF